MNARSGVGCLEFLCCLLLLFALFMLNGKGCGGCSSTPRGYYVKDGKLMPKSSTMLEWRRE